MTAKFWCFAAIGLQPRRPVPPGCAFAPSQSGTSVPEGAVHPNMAEMDPGLRRDDEEERLDSKHWDCTRYRVASIISSTSRSRSLPKKISSPTKKVGEPKVPRATDRSVLSSSRALTSES